MKISKETWKDILKNCGYHHCHHSQCAGRAGDATVKNSITKLKKCAGSRKYLLQAHLFKKIYKFH